MFEALDKPGKGVISTQKLTELIDMIHKDNELGVKEKDLIEFADPTFYGHITFNYYVQALSQCCVEFNGNHVSILKYVNEISD
jgi:Ca2+-binding EF-hand superfamily protein